MGWHHSDFILRCTRCRHEQSCGTNGGLGLLFGPGTGGREDGFESGQVPTLNALHLSFWGASARGLVVRSEMVLCRDCGYLHRRRRLTWFPAWSSMLVVAFGSLFDAGTRRSLRELLLLSLALVAGTIGAFHFHSFCSGVGLGFAALAAACLVDEVLLWLIVRLGYFSKARALRAASACPACQSQRKRPIKGLEVGPVTAPCPACHASRELSAVSLADRWETED
jgi:ssDNA-binding Zn-finger/Zn-ribbon topoisomerase 1